MNTDNQNSEVFRYYSSVSKKDVDWLWYPYIPYGKITLVEGDPGEGKSTFMLHIAALLTKGMAMPDGYNVPHPANVIYQCNEDDISDTIKPRLTDAGADCSRVAYILDDDNSLTLDDERIETTISKTKARLFILDPLQSYLVQDGDMQSAGRMRGLLGKLSVIAAKHQCAIVLIGHMNKASGNKNLYRGLGSIDIAAIARSILMVVRDPNESETRYMIPIKSSLAPEGSAVGFRFDKNMGFQWINTVPKRTEIELPKSYSPFKHSDASDSIIVLLRNGPIPSTEVFSRIKEFNVSERTLYTIKKELNILSFKENNIWYWKLPDGEEE